MLRYFKQFILTTLFAVFASQASAIFIQPDWLDPTQPGVGTNRYSYSFNDPINNTDPGGNACIPCVVVPAFEGLKWLGITLGVVGAGVGTHVAIDQMTTPEAGVSVGDGIIPIVAERRFGDLEPIDAPGHNAPRPELEELSDDDLIGAIFDPADGQRIKVRGNRILDGNGRIKEAGRRGLFGDDDYIPVEELETDEDMAPWENDGDDEDQDD